MKISLTILIFTFFFLSTFSLAHAAQEKKWTFNEGKILTIYEKSFTSSDKEIKIDGIDLEYIGGQPGQTYSAEYVKMVNNEVVDGFAIEVILGEEYQMVLNAIRESSESFPIQDCPDKANGLLLQSDVLELSELKAYCLIPVKE